MVFVLNGTSVNITKSYIWFCNVNLIITQIQLYFKHTAGDECVIDNGRDSDLS